MFAFCNNKILFETFYMIYKEKKGKHIGMLNLSNLEQFIIINNRIVSQNATELLQDEKIMSMLKECYPDATMEDYEYYLNNESDFRLFLGNCLQICRPVFGMNYKELYSAR